MTGSPGNQTDKDDKCPLTFYPCIFKDAGECTLGIPSQEVKPCMLGVAETLVKKEDLAALTKDAHENGYKALAIEYHHLRFNKADTIVELEHRYTQSLKKLTDTGQFLPLPFKGLREKSQHRASEFAKKYHCQRIFSKIGHEELGFPDNLLARIGTSFHAVCNQQQLPWIHENDMLVALGIEPISRKMYCEVPLLYNYKDIATSIHADDLLQFLPNELEFGKDIGDIGVHDMKRKAYSTHEEKGHKMQLAANVLGAEQSIGVKSKWFYIITSKRPRKAVVGRHRLPEYHIGKIAREGITVEDFHSLLVDTNKEQAQLLDDRVYWNSNKEKLTKKGICGNCFDKDTCNYVTGIMNENRQSMRETLEDTLDVVLPNKELPAP